MGFRLPRLGVGPAYGVAVVATGAGAAVGAAVGVGVSVTVASAVGVAVAVGVSVGVALPFVDTVTLVGWSVCPSATPPTESPATTTMPAAPMRAVRIGFARLVSASLGRCLLFMRVTLLPDLSFV